MKKRLGLVLSGLVAFALGACQLPPPTPKDVQIAQTDVRAELAARAGGDLSTAKFLLMKTSWSCIENCSDLSKMSFSDKGRPAGELTALVRLRSRSFEAQTHLFPGYQLSLKEGRTALPCRFITDNYIQCDVMDTASGMTDHAIFKRS
ncbi:hypothetical protein K2Q00_03760 [Patescibacteria group bacterium]|nr:hypothetical protein [Patescibacteria group bacterium]